TARISSSAPSASGVGRKARMDLRPSMARSTICTGLIASSSQKNFIAPDLLAVLQLLEDGRILQGGNVLRHLLALGQRAQQAAHDLAGTGLGQVVAEADVLGLGDGADLAGNPVAQVGG